MNLWGRFPGSEITELAAASIADSMYAQCDIDGNEYLLLDLFIDHGKDNLALSSEDQKIVFKVEETTRKSMAGWGICCKYKDGSALWETLSNLKESHPIQNAEYALAWGNEHKLTINWWVHHVLKK